MSAYGMVHPPAYPGYSIYNIKPRKEPIHRHKAKRRRAWWKPAPIQDMHVEIYWQIKPRRQPARVYECIKLSMR